MLAFDTTCGNKLNVSVLPNIPKLSPSSSSLQNDIVIALRLRARDRSLLSIGKTSRAKYDSIMSRFGM